MNTRGELVGINAMLASPTGSNIGYGFAIPTAIMNKVVDDLKQYGNVQRAMIGIQGSDVKSYVDNQKDNGKDIDLGTMEGIYVAKVVEDGAAEAAGLKEGDVITTIDAPWRQGDHHLSARQEESQRYTDTEERAG